MNRSLDVDAVGASFVAGRLRRTEFDAVSAPPVDLWIDDAFDRNEKINQHDPEPIEFAIPLPEFCFDGQRHKVEIRFGDEVRVQYFESEYQGYIDPFSENLITGWAVDLSRPATPVKLEIDVNGALSACTTANVYREDLNSAIGFECRVPATADMDRSFVLRARVAGTDIDLQGSPVLSLARPRLVKAAQQFNAAFHYLEHRLLWAGRASHAEPKLTESELRTFTDVLLASSSAADLMELRHRFLRPMQRQLTEQYARRDYRNLGIQYPQSVPRRARSAHRDRPVDIIVPIFAGLRETEACLKSVLASPCGCRYELICVLDNPEASDLRAMVQGIAAAHEHVLVLENPANQGFAGSVNRAMTLHRDRDVLILQADCEVHGDWLLRLQDAAYEGAGAGMVNPLAGHAEFLSYPAWDVELPPDASFERLDELARRAGPGRAVAIPAALGFCIYLRRGCLDDLGFFHNDEASGGYYAEKYFSVNAAAQGWRTIVAPNVFVKHRRFVAFAEHHVESIEMARDAFERWCPFYADSVTDFLVDDPLLPAKRELDLARLEQLDRQFFCLISHGGGGGTERHLQDMARAMSLDGLAVMVIFVLPDASVSLNTFALPGIENLRYRVDAEFDRLVSDLKRLRVRHVHIHSNVDMPRALFALPGRLGIPYDVTVHDYAWFCPRVNLVNRSGEYCGEPPVSVCETCAGGGVAALLEQSRRDLAGARRIFCPSEDARNRMLRHFELSNLQVRPHPEWIGEPEWRTEALAGGATVRVATIGRLSGHKGLRVVRECAAHALEWNLPLQFVVVGSTSDDSEFSQLPNVEITGPYEDGDVDDLVERLDVRVALLPSVWPETYSYTLSIAMRCGLIPVAFNLGAISERLRAAKTGVLLPLGTAASAINEALLQAARMQMPKPCARGTGYLNMLRDYYNLA